MKPRSAKTASSFILFDTAIGACALAWTDAGVVRLHLPEATPAATREKMASHIEVTRAPQWVRDATRRVTRHLLGDIQDLTQIPLDLSGAPPFFAKVYEIARAIPSSQTMTYAELAARAGSPGATRAVGQSMAKNPIAILIPCHRVLAAGGRPGGFSAHGGAVTKAKILATEGVTLGTGTASLFSGSDHGFPFDPKEATAFLSAKDPKLARLIAAAGPFEMKLDRSGGAFAALAQSIVYQQLTGKAAATILGRVRSLLEATPGRAERGTPAFFTPRQLLAAKDSDLRLAGLSGSKVRALRDLAEKAESGLVPTYSELEKMDEESIIAHLTQIRGIGRWTVEMMLMFRLGRPDVLPVGDYGVRKGFARTFRTKELPTPAELTRRAARWRPYRTVASWYLWRALDLA